MDHSDTQHLVGQHHTSRYRSRKCLNIFLGVCACCILLAVLIAVLVFFLFPRKPEAYTGEAQAEGFVIDKANKAVLLNITQTMTVYNPNYVNIIIDDLSINVYHPYLGTEFYLGNAKLDHVDLAKRQNTTFGVRINIVCSDPIAYSGVLSDAVTHSGNVPLHMLGNITITYLKLSISPTIDERQNFQASESPLLSSVFASSIIRSLNGFNERSESALHLHIIGNTMHRTSLQVLNFIPNYVGKSHRQLTLLILPQVILGFWHFSSHSTSSTPIGSFGMDMVDGSIARSLNQSKSTHHLQGLTRIGSRFGAALDMLTDKMSTPGLFLAMSQMYTDFKYPMLACMMLDVISHYFQIYSTLLRGVKSHKIIDPNEPFLLRMFYGNFTFFTCTCLGHEIFTILLYVLRHTEGPYLFGYQVLLVPAVLTFPWFICKTCVHVVQLASSALAIATFDAETFNDESNGKTK
ncbi:phosphatidylinositol synthase (PIS) [Planoprotostelium fungivorum]|uniref:Phosphatidylinositol synthase (PIS) n=1 Tax=Planoprotostelium fungivorum TaxID=1890364 RepID=A0A2P6N097_9EUKA|nr:phosphatidylinositol synthase (PIS) [Planoprotostelium fungivorum]